MKPALPEAARSSRGLVIRLACISGGTELCPQARAAARVVRPPVQALLVQLEPGPALVLNHLGDLLAWTDGYDRLARPLGILDDEEPNLAWFVFTDARARAAFPDWDDIADASPASTPRPGARLTTPAPWPTGSLMSPAPSSPAAGPFSPSGAGEPAC